MINRVPRPRREVPGMEWLLHAWGLAGAHHFGPPPAEERIILAEVVIGHALPEALAALYEMGDGATLCSGELTVHRIGGEDLSLVSASDTLRAEGWAIPEELRIFASDFADAHYGLWWHPGIAGELPVVQIADRGNPAALAIAGTDVVRFLTRLTLMELLSTDASAEVLDALGVPPELRRPEVELAEVSRWADPDLPHHPPDAAAQRLTPEQVRALLA